MILFEVLIWYVYSVIGFDSAPSLLLAGFNLVTVGAIAAFGFAMTLSYGWVRNSWGYLMAIIFVTPIIIGIIVQFVFKLPVSDPRWEPTYTSYSIFVMAAFLVIQFFIQAYLIRKRDKLA